jgi:hypothetical protein
MGKAQTLDCSHIFDWTHMMMLTEGEKISALINQILLNK